MADHDAITPAFVRRCLREKDYKDGKFSLSELKILLEKDNLNDLISMGLSVGMEYSEIMKMDTKRFMLVYRGKLKYLERVMGNINDSNRIQAIKISQAFNDIKEFNRDNRSIKLLDDNTEEKIARAAIEDEIPKKVVRENILRG